MRSLGGMLLEVLLVIVIIGGLIPFLHRQNINKKEALDFSTIASEMYAIKNVFETYITETPILFENTTQASQIAQVQFSDLHAFGLPESFKEKNRYNMTYTLIARRRVLNTGTPMVEGLILLSTSDFTRLQVRKMTQFLGPQGGYSDEGFIYSANQSWMEPLKAWDLSEKIQTIVLKIDAIQDNQNYIYRIKTSDSNNQKMTTHLKMGYHDIKNIKLLDVEFIDVSDTLYYKTSRKSLTEPNAPGIETFEMQNTSRLIALEDASTECPTEDLVCPPFIGNLKSSTDGLTTISGYGKIKGSLNVTDETIVTNNLFLTSNIQANSAKSYALDIGALSIADEQEERVYKVEAKNININKFTTETNLLSLTPMGLFDAISFSEGASINGFGTSRTPSFTDERLTLKDAILKNLNEWIWDNKENCKKIYTKNAQQCSESISTAPLFDCLTTGIDIDGTDLKVAGKGYSTDRETFTKSVSLSDILICLKTISNIIAPD